MSFAQNTPIQFLPGIGVRTAHVLHELDIHTAGQLARIPEKMLIELFGPSIRSVLMLVHGTTKTLPIMQKKFSPRVTVETTHMRPKKTFFRRLQLATQFIGML
ncbi:MAG: hypothetical protein HYV32_01200 [Candidatus Kerfeldbacteria bacterium]|nr:hypothetical protein [Candidatus Kerfeldbacteria bacterium]